MPARDDELRERRRRELVERDHRLGGRSLDHQRPGALEELRREVAGRGGGADEDEEAAQELRRIAWAVPPVLLDPRHELVRRGNAARDPERRRLDHGERPEQLGPASRQKERAHAAVRVPDKVRAGHEELLEPDGLVLEVDMFDVRSRREPAPVRRHDLEALGERFLGAPGQVRVDDGTVNEQRGEVELSMRVSGVTKYRFAGHSDTAILAADAGDHIDAVQRRWSRWRPGRVVVAEGPGHRRDIEYLVTGTGLFDVLRDVGVDFVDLNQDDVRRVPLKSRFMGLAGSGAAGGACWTRISSSRCRSSRRTTGPA